MPVIACRLADKPIIHPGLDKRMGDNINGPSLVRSPWWVPNPLGGYLLYFADHRGKYIRLAYADEIEGPWTIHGPGCLNLADSLYCTEAPDRSGFRPEWASHPDDWFYPHIASPDVHVDEQKREVRMYLHGLLENGEQLSRVALSYDGLHFRVLPELLGPPYFRVFRYGEWWYAMAHPNEIYRSKDGLRDFQLGPKPLPKETRHTAVLVKGDILHCFWSQIWERPEQIYHGTIDLTVPWSSWTVAKVNEVLRPELAWEGTGEPMEASVAGAADVAVNQLRDPCIFTEGEEVYLLYSGAGERAIGLAALSGL